MPMTLNSGFVAGSPTWDPNKPPTINLSGEERQLMQAEEAMGLLPPGYYRSYLDAMARNVFGNDTVKNRDGSYQEQGIGAKGHETLNHYTSLKKAESMGLELPGTYDKAVAELWKRDPARAKAIGLMPPSR